jgi:hypothetical protein
MRKKIKGVKVVKEGIEYLPDKSVIAKLDKPSPKA